MDDGQPDMSRRSKSLTTERSQKKLRFFSSESSAGDPEDDDEESDNGPRAPQASPERQRAGFEDSSLDSADLESMIATDDVKFKIQALATHLAALRTQVATAMADKQKYETI